jgi:D-alanyl-D-alanine carboxypeptidase
VLVIAGALTPIPSRSTTAAEAGPTTQPTAAPPDWLQMATVDATASSSPTAVSAPEWVQCQEETGLWSGADDRAQLFSMLPAGTTLRPLGSFQGGRLLVDYAGDGASRAPGQGWVDARSVQPGAAPSSTPTTNALAMRALAPPPTRIDNSRPPSVTAQYIAIVDEDSGQLIYDDGAHVRTPPASVTKIATTIVALEHEPDLQRVIDVTVNGWVMQARDGSSIMGLEPGEKITLETLLYGMMLPSGNDAAEQTALAVGGTREHFVQMMNEKVASLGLKDTQFASPSGMDTPGHYSSAYDMAMLARYGMQNAEFRKLAGTKSYYAPGYNLYNANRLIGNYAGADGVKIGYTDLAGKTIVGSVTRNGHRVYVSLMKSQDLPGDSIALFDWVWDTFRW